MCVEEGKEKAHSNARRCAIETNCSNTEKENLSRLILTWNAKHMN